MDKNVLTSRQKQAIQTKKRIYDAAVYLMQKHGFEDATIEQVCKKAKVSVGSFYNYFKSKHDVLSMFYESVDIYFRDVVAGEVESMPYPEKIITFFSHYARYAESNGLDFVSHLFGNNENKLFIKQDRYMHILMHQILVSAQHDGKLTQSMPLEAIEQFLFILARGVVNDWCLYDGSYDLVVRMEQSFQLILPVIIV